MQVTPPSYGLNEALAVRTVEPPVPMARAWAESYPSTSSPLRIETSSFSSSSSASSSNVRPPLLNLAQGVPGHPPHPKLLDSMTKEREVNIMESHGYGPVFGDASLRKQLAKDLTNRYLGLVKDAEVAITSGGNLAAGVIFHALASPGEAIVLPTPWYFNHEMTLTSLSIEVLPLETTTPEFLPKTSSLVELLEKHNSFPHSAKNKGNLPRIKAMVLVTPNNPTGSIYSKEVIWQFAQICSDWKIALVIDETYRDFLLDEHKTLSDDQQHPLATPHDLFNIDAHPGFHWQNTVISLNSFSKSYAIPGHRLGAIIAHSSLLISQHQDNGKKTTVFGCLAKSLDNLQICPARTDTQRAVAASIFDEEQVTWRLNVANDLLKRRSKFFANLQDKISPKEMARRLNLDEDVVSQLTSHQRKDTLSPSDVGWKGLSSGGYYAYVRHPFPDTPSEIVARGLAALVGVVVLPGSFFRPTLEAKDDRDLRVSIANVESSKLDTLGSRFLLLHALWTSKGIGWGI